MCLDYFPITELGIPNLPPKSMPTPSFSVKYILRPSRIFNC